MDSKSKYAKNSILQILQVEKDLADSSAWSDPKYWLSWDPDKDASNIQKHGISLEFLYAFDWSSAVYWRSDRDGDPRILAISYIEHQRYENRLYAAVLSEAGIEPRGISLRPASSRERVVYQHAHCSSPQSEDE